MKFFDKKRDLEAFQDGDQIAGVDDDNDSDDDNSGDEGNEEEEPIVANLDHHQENDDRGTNDIGSLVTDLEDLQ
ncbi:unnamed protein product [Cylindrotheca closterium]|uniref:Uncharacterized protein n=1 Tax=Cylindrotheca closterium TaxID=2856 RepID=A0AAD2FJT7_9STRA|nr:unnamed protein product [Cylindrotheca closterium]